MMGTRFCAWKRNINSGLHHQKHRFIYFYRVSLDFRSKRAFHLIEPEWKAKVHEIFCNEFRSASSSV